MILIVFLQYLLYLATTEEVPENKDIGNEDYDDLGRKHRKKKKHQNNPCGGGYGRTFGEKFGPHDYTYINAPVTNYFFGCGGGPAPVAQYPAQFGGHGGHGHGGHGHGGHGHGGHGQGGYGLGGYGHGGHGQGSYGSYGGFQGFQGPANYGYNQGYQQYPNQYQNYNRPFQNVVSAAASGFGNAVAGYLSRPRKVNKQVNQLLKPLYKLF